MVEGKVDDFVALVMLKKVSKGLVWLLVSKGLYYWWLVKDWFGWWLVRVCMAGG